MHGNKEDCYAKSEARRPGSVLKSISDAFEEQHAKLEAEKNTAPTLKTRTNSAR